MWERTSVPGIYKRAGARGRLYRVMCCPSCSIRSIPKVRGRPKRRSSWCFHATRSMRSSTRILILQSDSVADSKSAFPSVVA